MSKDTKNLILEMSAGIVFHNVVLGMLAIVVCSCLLYTSPSPRDRQKSRMPSSA